MQLGPFKKDIIMKGVSFLRWCLSITVAFSGLVNLWTRSGPSDPWTFGPVDLRTRGPSDSWAVTNPRKYDELFDIEIDVQTKPLSRNSEDMKLKNQRVKSPLTFVESII